MTHLKWKDNGTTVQADFLEDKSLWHIEGEAKTFNIYTGEKPIGYYLHTYSKSIIPIYKKPNIFKQFMMRVCFGLKFYEYKLKE